MTRRKIFIISGPSGVGKGTILRKLLSLDNIKDKVEITKSFTTRNPRFEDEKKNYYFISKEEFKMRKDFLVESNEYADSNYGTSYMELERILFQENKHAILEIDQNGMEQIKRKIKYTPIVSVFIISDAEEVIQRLIERGTESREQIYQRLEIAKREIETIDKYNFVINNYSIDRAVEDLKKIICEEEYNILKFDKSIFQEKIDKFLKMN